MAQPTIQDIFGANSVLSEGGLTLTLSLTDFTTVGLEAINYSDPEKLFAALVIIASTWLIPNIDETVPLTCDKQTSSPITRNNLDKTLYQFIFGFYSDYLEPPFDPDNII